ncbi:tail fiber assembly protein [Caballeronia zhejiangensis]|uniref:tail fiber assembly protein n=1 Tax=Caballeronia zhejiangensis TaxID=871203 RepID=UPI001F522002|nr:tail fiber assembly protein [Caballeronia zhejiangensis]MCI1046954.1 hypothetical protein [Caballeronia zhejiangensis]
MSKRAAHIADGVVTNIIVVDDDYDNSDPTVVALPDGSQVSFGWLYDGSNFTMTQDMITSTYNDLVASANNTISSLQASNDPALPTWQNYLAALQAMDLTANNPPQWPVRPSNTRR